MSFGSKTTTKSNNAQLLYVILLILHQILQALRHLLQHLCPIKLMILQLLQPHLQRLSFSSSNAYLSLSIPATINATAIFSSVSTTITTCIRPTPINSCFCTSPISSCFAATVFARASRCSPTAIASCYSSSICSYATASKFFHTTPSFRRFASSQAFPTPPAVTPPPPASVPTPPSSTSPPLPQPGALDESPPAHVLPRPPTISQYAFLSESKLPSPPHSVPSSSSPPLFTSPLAPPGHSSNPTYSPLLSIPTQKPTAKSTTNTKGNRKFFI